jgi:SAM-dependent methyltransferase/predicted  nucleic acid-binding Zn-ribbon protein
LPEFTGERVVPGLVDADLFNEHLARYRLAARWGKGMRILDAGCGTGYGAAELAQAAAHVTAIDASAEAVAYAREHFQAPNLDFAQGDCLHLPQGPFDLITAFEVIEHLADWRGFLREAHRALSPEGLFLVSTPNKLYYKESRGESGGNPFHVHEFEFGEFREELENVFPQVNILLQNHVEGVAFAHPDGGAIQAEVDPGRSKPEDCHFFLAVCAVGNLPALDGYCWIPGTGNVLRERERHIGLLTGEIALKDEWLQRSKAELEDRNREYSQLLDDFRKLNAQLEERNRWARATFEEAERRGARILELQEELAREQANFADVAAGYGAKVSELEETNRAKTAWAIETERRLTQEIHERSEELARCAALLDQAEGTIVERTIWAQGLQKELEQTSARLAALRSTRLVRAGAKLKLVPEA